jgi:hypothetical protein
MNEIKVYHSVWKTAVTMLADLLIVALGVMAILKGSTPVIAWFLVVFFCFGAGIAAYPPLKERLTGTPYLTITDGCVIVDGRKVQEIRYADVESFVLKRAFVERVIVVNYKSEKATPGAIMVSDLTVKPEELFKILDGRLAACR